MSFISDKWEGKHSRGFTLLELIVVVAVLLILAAFLLPTLQSVKDKARTVTCLNNLRQLQIAWHLYPNDNRGILVPNNYVYNGILDTPFLTNVSWCPGLAPIDTTSDNIRSGLLFPYARAVGVYRCPADRSTADGTNILRTRSYDMSQSVNGYPEYDPAMYTHFPSYKKLEQITDPPVSRLFVFADVHEDSITDSIFGTPTRVWGNLNTWWDIPANRHNQGANFSFADGHQERWRWDAPKKVWHAFPQPVATNETADHARVLGATRQNF